MISWTIGSIAAFLIARIYGKRIVEKLADLESLKKLESAIGDKNIFITSLLLRMIIPVDILSYALGLFSNIRITPYIISTIIGIIPFVIFFSYAIKISLWMQLIIAVIVISLVTFILKKYLR